jgi:hypothetical protein
MEPQSAGDGAEEWIFVRFYDYHTQTITFNMITLHRQGGMWRQSVEATELRPIFRDELVEALAQTGFGQVECLGGYDGSAFVPERSGDLIVVAQRS